MDELETVILIRDLPEHGLKEGDIGTVVMVHRDPPGYEVEFSSSSGETIAVVSLIENDIRSMNTDHID